MIKNIYYNEKTKDTKIYIYKKCDYNLTTRGRMMDKGYTLIKKEFYTDIPKEKQKELQYEFVSLLQARKELTKRIDKMSEELYCEGILPYRHYD